VGGGGGGKGGGSGGAVDQVKLRGRLLGLVHRRGLGVCNGGHSGGEDLEAVEVHGLLGRGGGDQCEG